MKSKKIQNNYMSITLLSTLVTAIAFGVVSACTNGQAKDKPNFIFKAATKPGIVAKIAGEDITEEALIGEDKSDFFELKKREYDLKMERINKMVSDRLIGAEAKKAKLSTEEYLNKTVFKAVLKPTQAEFDKFVAERNIPKEQINDQIKERINNYLEGDKKQKLLMGKIAALTKSSPVEIYFQKPKMMVQVDPGNGPSTGSSSAKVKVVVFSDFQCPFCSRGANTVDDIKKKYGSKVQITFRHFPLPMHKDAKPASEASMCVNEQSTDKFWKYHNLVFKNQDKLDAEHLKTFAKDVGANVGKFEECIKANKFAGKVAEDMAYGEKIGVRSTPTFYVNGQMVAGALPIDAFSEIIDEELEAK